MTERSTPLREALDAHVWEAGYNVHACRCGWRTRGLRSESFMRWADHREQAVRAALASERIEWPDGEEAERQLVTAMATVEGIDLPYALAAQHRIDDARAVLAALRET